MDDLHSPSVGLDFGVGNVSDSGFPGQWIETMGSHITCIHVKHVLRNRGRVGGQTVFTSLFKGDNNWPAIHRALNRVQYDGGLVAETETRYKYAIHQQFFDMARAMDRVISGDLPVAT